jgi:8-oxo-dGTP diphosphatase
VKSLNEVRNINAYHNEIKDYFISAISVDCVVFAYESPHIKILNIHSDLDTYKGMLSLIGDLVKKHENLDQAARRILKERTGLQNIHLKQVGAFGDPDRHPLGRVISVAYYALINKKAVTLDTHKPLEPSWMNLSEIPQLAFDHNRILSTCLDHLREDLMDKHIWNNLLPDSFTLGQIQTLVEAVLGKKMDKRNFRKKMLQSGILRDTKRTQKNVAHRPAKLYAFVGH